MRKNLQRNDDKRHEYIVKTLVYALKKAMLRKLVYGLFRREYYKSHHEYVGTINKIMRHSITTLMQDVWEDDDISILDSFVTEKMYKYEFTFNWSTIKETPLEHNYYQALDEYRNIIGEFKKIKITKFIAYGEQ